MDLDYEKAREILIKHVDVVQKREHKIILNDNAEMIDMANYDLMKTVSISEDDSLYPALTFTIPPLMLVKYVREINSHLASIPYPYPLPKPLTKEQCYEFLMEDVKILTDDLNITSGNRKVLVLLNFFQDFTLKNIIDEESQKNFIDMLFDLSKEYTLIMTDPRCPLGAVPFDMIYKAKTAAMMNARVTAFKWFMKDFLEQAVVINLRKEVNKSKN